MQTYKKPIKYYFYWYFPLRLFFTDHAYGKLSHLWYPHVCSLTVVIDCGLLFENLCGNVDSGRNGKKLSGRCLLGVSVKNTYLLFIEMTSLGYS